MMQTDKGRLWGMEMRDAGALCSALLYVVHPQLYAAARHALLSAAARSGRVRQALAHWPSLWHNLQIISNRESPYHRDMSGKPPWYELLMTLGSYPRATLVLRNAGMQLAYLPGTAVFMASKVLHHGVAKVDPDRLVYTWFMSACLHDNHAAPDVPWVYRCTCCAAK